MSFILNLVRAFPEFHGVINAFSGLISSDEKLLAAIEKTFSDNFSEFADAQPSELSDGLDKIKSISDDQIHAQKELVSTLKTLPNDLQELRVIYENYQKQAEVLEKQRANGCTPDEGIIHELKEIKKKFVVKLTTVLLNDAQARLKCAEQLKESGDEFVEATQMLHDYDDIAILKLQNRLKELEYEMV